MYPLIRQAVLAVAGTLCLGLAQAVTVSSVSPQGEVAQVRQVTVKFSEAVVPLGDLRLPPPFGLSCEGKAPGGQGRWANDRVWVYDFEAPLDPGSRCVLQALPAWKPLAGSLTGTTRFEFGTGGPAIVSLDPVASQEARIEEDQHFVARLSGPVVPASLGGNAWCEIEGLGDRIPLEAVNGKLRGELLKAAGVSGKEADDALVLHCARALPADAVVRLVWGKGIAAAANPKVATRVEQRFRYRVRAPLKAEFSCSRERAGEPCWPLSAMNLSFSAPIPRALAEKIRLQPESGKALSPVFRGNNPFGDVEELIFPQPLPANTTFKLELPSGLKDNSDRPLSNVGSFPLTVKTGEAPPIAKFATSPFGVLEHGPDAMLPVTLRHVQGDMRPGAAGGSVRVLNLQTDADIFAWYFKLKDGHEDWELRDKSWLKANKAAKRVDLPELKGGDPRPFEVVGIPLPQPGYQVVEIESRRLGEALLDPKGPMYVRTGALVTNLGVHVKISRENSLVWVTTLDKARPVEGAEVAVNDCNGQRLASGKTDAQGLVRFSETFDERKLKCKSSEGLFVTARKADGQGVVDTSFAFSGWTKGIESWRYGVPVNTGSRLSALAHTVFDRSLLRAGETISMKHFIRTETSTGLALMKASELPSRVKIVHEGSGQEFVQPLSWRDGRHALSSWNIPASAKLGVYAVYLERDGDASRINQWVGGGFRVEEFRVPLLDAKLTGPKGAVVAPRELPLSLQLNYMAGGGVAQSGLKLSSMLQSRYVQFSGYADFSFEPPRDRAADAGDGEGEVDAPTAAEDGRLVADKLALATDRNGAASVTLKDLPKISRPSELVSEVGFTDPNGETQTVSTRTALWPSAVVLGIKAGSWASNKGRVTFQALALDTSGKPIKGQSVEVRGSWSQVITSRKRIVGGFYAYDNHTEVKDLGKLCSGSTDDRGLLLCEAELDQAGEVQLIAHAKDGAGNPASAATSVWITRQGELWFTQDNDDRMDVLPEKRHYQPGDIARLQVRMPFREATALVSVEREGIVSTQVVELRGNDPTIELKIEKEWGPNVYVSVLAMRGRVRHVPWYSFFTWGWKEPVNWARAFWYEGREYQAPTAMVDLAKPAFKLGVASFTVGVGHHELKVEVSADKAQYTVRQTARARIKVTREGRPVKGAGVAFAAVDEGLLALRPNASWDLLGGMLQERAWGVETATGQSEIIGRRHYGRKALAAGGDGGKNPTRELFDTLLLWKPDIVTDANGEASVEVPLNDSLTSFRLVAVADAEVQQFGTGSTSIRVSQDLQMLSGMPPLVREGDHFDAMFTLRNTTGREMKLRATLAGTANSGAGISREPLALAPQELVLAAGAAQEVRWPVSVPDDVFSFSWEASVEELGGEKARDRLKFTQLVSPAVPVRVLQATLAQLDGPYSVAVAAPADALPAAGAKRGGLSIGVQPTLSGALPGMRRYFETYPFICLEQKTSKAVGLKDAKLWSGVANDLATYLDSDGLASYFPPRAEEGARGSDRLTAYLLAATHEAGFALPEQARESMLKGLAAFVEGRIERKFWAPRADLDVRKLAALEALSRHGRATPAMLGSINLTPNLWPTAAVIDWYNILRRVKGIPEQAARLEEAQQILRSRLTYAGTTLKFSTEADDFWWWLMDSPDSNAARLILAVLDDPAWKDELPRLVVGSLGRQRNGAWLTTTANLWGSLALDKFSARFESVPVAGTTLANAGGQPQSLDWAKRPQGGVMTLPWPDKPARLSVQQEGSGKPWLTVQSLAAVPLKAPLRAGYSVNRTVSAVEQKVPGSWSRGDVLRVRLEIDAQTDMTWVVVSDPVPGGGTLLGSGLGRDSEIAERSGRGQDLAFATFEERSFEAFRSYFEYLPKGKHVVEYTVRLNNPGKFLLPPTRVEAMYAPETFGELPNAALEVKP